jgi:hypothetical protein
MFHQSFSTFEWRLWAGGNISQFLRSPEANDEITPRHHRRRKSLLKRLEEQQRELKQLSFEGLPQLQQSNDIEEEGSGCNDSFPHALDDQDGADNDNETLNSCPVTPSASCPHNDGDGLDSPLTHPPRTVTVRAGDLHVVSTPRAQNRKNRIRLFSFGDFSTICSDKEETSKGVAENEDLTVEEDPTAAAATLNHDEWEIETAVTYPPKTIMLVSNNDPLDAIATPRRRAQRHYSSDLSSCSLLQHQQLPVLPKFDTDDEYYEPLCKLFGVKDDAEEDEDHIPHVMSSPAFHAGDDDEDDDDDDDFPYAEIRDIREHFNENGSCPGRTNTDVSCF